MLNPPPDHAKASATGTPRGQPLYQQTAQILLARIEAGVYGLGTNLPTEVELRKEFSVSHHTVRDALKILIDKGLIVRRAGSGSTVIALKQATVFTHVAVDLHQLVSYPGTARRENIAAEHITADADEARLLQCPVGTPWFRISAVRRTGSNPEPVCWTYFYLLPRYARVIKNKDHLEIPVYEQIERLSGDSVARAKIDTYVGRIPANIARQLLTTADSPALVTVRRYLDSSDQPLHVTLSYHPEGRYINTLDFKRETRNR